MRCLILLQTWEQLLFSVGMEERRVRVEEDKINSLQTRDELV